MLQYYVQERRLVQISLKIKCPQNANEVETKDFERSSYLVKLWVSRHHLHWSELLLRYSVSILMNADFLRFFLWIQYTFVCYGSICTCTIQLSIGREDTRENSFSSNHCLKKWFFRSTKIAIKTHFCTLTEILYSQKWNKKSNKKSKTLNSSE